MRRSSSNQLAKLALLTFALSILMSAMQGCNRGSSDGATVGTGTIGDSVACGNYLLSIACTAHLWSADHDDRLPPDLVCLSNEFVPKILICPGDHTRSPAPNWAAFSPTNSSYELVTPGFLMDASATNTVILRCKFHGNEGYADGSVFDGTQRRRTKLP